MAQAAQKKGRDYTKGVEFLDDGYVRPSMSVSRWSLGSAIFKENFGKMVLLNLLMLVFLAPLGLMVFNRFSNILSAASSAPFTANLGLGFMPVTSLVGYEEQIIFSANRSFFLLLPIALLWLSLGFSGVLYIMRKLVNDENVNIAKDFFIGVKRNFLQIALTSLIIGLLISVVGIGLSYMDLASAVTGGSWINTAVKIISIIMLCFVGIMYLLSLTLSVNYKVKFTALIRNSFLILTALIPINIFFAAFCLLPYLFLLLGQSLLSLGIIIIALFGNSFFLLSWTVYSHWVFDKFINVHIPESKRKRAEPKTSITSDDGYESTTQEGYTTNTKSFGYARAVKPIYDKDVELKTLGGYFSRADMDEFNKSREAMKKDSDDYANARIEAANKALEAKMLAANKAKKGAKK